MFDPEVDKQANEWKERLQEKHGITPKEVTKVEVFHSSFLIRKKILKIA